MPDQDRPKPRTILTGDFAPNPRSSYVELAVTTAFSFLRGASTAQELALTAHALGHDTLAVADLNSMAGVVRIHSAATEAALRPLIGCRLQLLSGESFLAYPRDRAAYARLCALLTKGKRQDASGAWQAKGACDLSLDDLAAHAEGVQLILIPGQRLARNLPRLCRRLPSLRHIAASYLYRGDDRARITRLDRLARAHGLSILATNDVHYHSAERRPLQDVMTCICTGTTIQTAGRLLDANAERHLKSAEEMIRLFADWPHAIRATRQVADACNFSLDELAYHYPMESVPEGETPQSQLEHLTWEGAARRYPEGVPQKVHALLEKELAIIALKKIPQYFLTVHDIVAWAQAQGILCQGRGSAANSAVCFVLGITSVDPSHQQVLFERFISVDRDEPPDIDVDFEHERREEVIQHIYARYGRHRAGLCGTVIHYRPRSAIREVGKAMGLSEDVTAALAKTVWGSWGSSMGEANSREAGVDLSDPLLSRALKLAEQMIGMPRHLSQHVGGFILTEGPLHETVPIGNGAMPERSFIEWDKDDIDALGILKVDILALGMLTCIRKCFDLLRNHYGIDYDLTTLPREDKATYEMLCKGDSLGVFQVESRAQMNMLPRLQPREFYDLVIEVAIVRPGPIQGDMVHPYLRRRNREEPVIYPAPGREHPQDELVKILGRTLGVPIFQEQAMQIAMEAAEFSSKEANELRKAMATFRSRGTIELLQSRMVGRMVKRGYDEAFARRCFDQIKGFGEYGFPESHAASFARLVYVSSYLKCHHPAAFACALLNAQPMGFYAPAQIVRDAVTHGVEVRPVDVNFSNWDNTLEPKGTGFALRLGLRQLDGLAAEAAARLMAARDAPYESLDDLARRSGLGASSIRALAAADAFGSAGLTRRAALWDARALRDAPDLPLFQAGKDEGVEPAVRLPQMPLAESVVADYQTLRLSLKAHPMAFLRMSMKRQGFVTASELEILPNGKHLRLAGLVLIRQRPGSAKGVCFITIEDETGVANLVLWPKVMEQFRKVVMTARLMQVTGRMQRDPRSGVTHVVAEDLRDRSDALLRLADRSFATPLARADHVRNPLPSPSRSHPRNARVIPNSRDFH
ncbi:error-prone DNA polymerase [Xinfangfangia sp. CPCC 101601]|uniref:Error-prone DNA polymerase n=1 Tax=Pseudogemmobacter lacusdianii TaxID=3069608 RepID=A0ABU0VVZ5_9RHOB|nr:error-prone DNA polymerase [Xinfangfangia sp. CPCC 101601]MDQ2065907.1 error-prone DNA polymerase [Xinfangfangia sp. CPCC 101601]